MLFKTFSLGVFYEGLVAVCWGEDIVSRADASKPASGHTRHSVLVWWDMGNIHVNKKQIWNITGAHAQCNITFL